MPSILVGGYMDLHTMAIGGLKARPKETLATPMGVALVILRKGLGLSPDQALGPDRPEVTPLEMRAAVRTVGSHPYVRISLVGEGGSARRARFDPPTLVGGGGHFKPWGSSGLTFAPTR